MTPDQRDVGSNQPEGCNHSFLTFSYAQWLILSQDDDKTSNDFDNTQLKSRFWQLLGEDTLLAPV